ncbi:MAG: alpha/beta fold hydrolase [Propionibacteriaceae bacterium]|jgi:carboxylesterase|nr:alpha/beta fold hydrolase [Propionibacteriaceae bacterium]
MEATNQSVGAASGGPQAAPAPDEPPDVAPTAPEPDGQTAIHEPLFGGDGDIGVLFCHGFTSSPWSLREWALTTLAAGYRVSLPRLPGHGTTWRELHATGWEDWYACVDREFRVLRRDCRQVFVAGLSLGGALALRLAEKHPDDVAGLLLVNPAVAAANPAAGLAGLLQWVLPSVKSIGSDIAMPGVEEHAYDRTSVKATASMLRLWTHIRSCLDLVTCPLLLFRSATDHVVPKASSDFILSHVSSQDIAERVLLRSYHVATMDYDKQQIFSQSLAFLRDHA